MQVDILGYWGGYPFQGGATAGYLISTEEGKILLDCGSGVMSKLSLKAKVEDLSGVILSHLHHDHTSDVGILQYAIVGALRTGKLMDKMNIFAPEEPENLWRALQSEQTDFLTIIQSTSHKIAGVNVEFCPVSHTIPCYAVKLTYKGKVFVYSADTAYDESLVHFASDADLFICEATICEGSIHTTGNGHMDAEQAGILAKKAKVKELVLTHLPHDGDFIRMKEQASIAFGKEAYMATEQVTYTL